MTEVSAQPWASHRKSGAGVAAEIRRKIITGELAEGAALPPEHVLIEQYDVSRPTMREAFRVLESEQLIYVKRGARGGARVRRPSADVAARYAGPMLQFDGATVAHVHQARTLIEAPAVRLAAERDRGEAVRRLRDNLREAEAALREDDVATRMPVLSREFHSAVMELTGNPALKLLDGMLHVVVDLGSRGYVSGLDDEPARRRSYATAYRAHLRVVDLLDADEIDAAEAIWRRHVRGVGEALTEGSPAGATVLDLLS